MPTITEHPRTVELQRFIESSYRQVVGSVMLVTGDRAAAEDAVQEALVKAWRRRDEPVERLAAWITVVASNEARTGHRRREAESRALAKAGVDPDSTTMTSDVIDTDLMDALRGLSVRERQVAVLFYVDDLSLADTAGALGVSEGTVKTLLSRARAHLAAALGGDVDGGNSKEGVW
jgi:RNA polymerase sigma-70 factor (ECF subfamily)